MKTVAKHIYDGCVCGKDGPGLNWPTVCLGYSLGGGFQLWDCDVPLSNSVLVFYIPGLFVVGYSDCILDVNPSVDLTLLDGLDPSGWTWSFGADWPHVYLMCDSTLGGDWMKASVIQLVEPPEDDGYELN